MKLRTTLFIALIALLLSACDFSLAEDVTPPPDYVPPTPVPTHGPVFPASAPDLQNGAVIYAEKCAPCHGDKGMGDGAQGQQLSVPVPALGLPEVANQATPADWFLTVTLGNMNNFMPPFSSLSEQERWDVVSYAFSLSTTPAQVEQGAKLFAANCVTCHTEKPDFATQERMSLLSAQAMDGTISNGVENKMPGFADSLNESDRAALIAYLRSLTYSASSPKSETASAAQTPGTESSSAGGTSVEGTPQAGAQTEASAAEGYGPVSGKVINGNGGSLPAGLKVDLRGFDHAQDTTTGPQEVLNLTTETDENGAYTFKSVEMPAGRIFLTEVTYQDITFQSDLAVADANSTEISVPDVSVYEGTTDMSVLSVGQMHISFDMTTRGSAQVFELISVSNPSDKAYTFTTDGTSLPFMPLPDGAMNVGLQISQDSAPIVQTTDGFALPPSDKSYNIVAFFDMAYDNELTLSQSMALPVASMVVIVPEGVTVKSSQLTDAGLQQTQQGDNVQTYGTTNLNVGDSIDMTVSGSAQAASATTTTDNRQTLLIGAGAFGFILILAGVWMFMRDRKRSDEDAFDEEDEEDVFETAEEVMDAIIALDDLHRAKKISDEAYQERRAELKERLKELS